MLNQFSRTELLLGKDWRMPELLCSVSAVSADIQWRLLPEAVWALLI